MATDLIDWHGIQRVWHAYDHGKLRTVSVVHETPTRLYVNETNFIKRASPGCLFFRTEMEATNHEIGRMQQVIEDNRAETAILLRHVARLEGAIGKSAQ